VPYSLQTLSPTPHTLCHFPTTCAAQPRRYIALRPQTVVAGPWHIVSAPSDVVRACARAAPAAGRARFCKRDSLRECQCVGPGILQGHRPQTRVEALGPRRHTAPKPRPPAVTVQRTLPAVTAQRTLPAVPVQRTLPAVTAQRTLPAITAQRTLPAVTAQRTLPQGRAGCTATAPSRSAPSPPHESSSAPSCSQCSVPTAPSRTGPELLGLLVARIPALPFTRSQAAGAQATEAMRPAPATPPRQRRCRPGGPLAPRVTSPGCRDGVQAEAVGARAA
jgi:hypothetical protein